VTFIAFLAVDAVWLALVARTPSIASTSAFDGSQPNWLASDPFLPVVRRRALVLAVLPGLETGSLKTTLLRGALFDSSPTPL